MKRKQDRHGFVTLVGEGPLEYLWNPRGYWTSHTRQRELTTLEVDALLLGSSDYRLVQAAAGAELRWYAKGDYGFWQHRAKSFAQHRPASRETLRYAASEWCDEEAEDRVILLQLLPSIA